MKRLLLLIIVLYSAGTANAQWHFSITSMNYNDNCGGGGWNIGATMAETEVAIRMGMAESEAAKTYSTREECEAGRSVANMNYSNSGCYLKITTSPCTGGNIGGGGAGGRGLGSGFQAGSLYSSIAIGENYFTPNAAHSIPDQGRELEIKLEALNKNFQNAKNGIKTGNQSFDKTYRKQSNDMPTHDDSDGINDDLYAFHPRTRNQIKDNPIYVRLFDAPVLEENYYRGKANLENIQQYLDASVNLTESFLANQQNLESILQNEFERVSGIDLTEILNKHPNDRTPEERQILTDYGAFKTTKIEEMYKELNASIDNTKEKNVVDAAILALDAYGDDDEGWLSKTNYKKVDIESLLSSNDPSNYNPIADIAFAIKTCNETQNDTGFHVELYYNETTNTYVISCAGTEPTDLFNDAIINDGSIALNLLGVDAEVAQYNMAKTIGDAINRIPQEQREQLNLEVVGHSLGGGIASVIGLTTGIETKTFNAATVPESFLKENGLFDKVNNGEIQNITAYHTSTDILTNAQEMRGTPAIGTSVNIGDPATPAEKEEARNKGTTIGTAISPAIGSYYGGNVGEMVAGHKMPAMTREFYNSRMKKEHSKLKKMNDAKTRLQDELDRIERLKQGY